MTPWMYLAGYAITFFIFYVYLIATEQVDSDDMEQLIPMTFLTLLVSAAWVGTLPVAILIVGGYHLGVWLKPRKYR